MNPRRTQEPETVFGQERVSPVPKSPRDRDGALQRLARASRLRAATATVTGIEGRPNPAEKALPCGQRLNRLFQGLPQNLLYTVGEIARRKRRPVEVLQHLRIEIPCKRTSSCAAIALGYAVRGLIKRRGRDLNPRRTQEPETVFETAAFDRSATPPRDAQGTRRQVTVMFCFMPAASCPGTVQ